MLSVKDLGHWKFGRKFEHTNYFGFLYCITNNKTKQYYIGKKQFFRGGKKRSKTYGKEMNWKSYTGSSKHVKEDISKYKKANFKFEMVDIYKTKGGLYYAEAYCQMLSNCMTRKLEDGITPAFYNRQIAAVRFVPKEEPTVKTIKYIEKLNSK